MGSQLFGPLALGDVAGSHRGAEHLARDVFDWGNRHGDLDGVTVLVPT